MCCVWVTANNKELIKHQLFFWGIRRLFFFLLKCFLLFALWIKQFPTNILFIETSSRSSPAWKQKKRLLQWFIDTCSAYNVSMERNINIFVISNVDEVWLNTGTRFPFNFKIQYVPNDPKPSEQLFPSHPNITKSQQSFASTKGEKDFPPSDEFAFLSYSWGSMLLRVR